MKEWRMTRQDMQQSIDVNCKQSMILIYRRMQGRDGVRKRWRCTDNSWLTMWPRMQIPLDWESEQQDEGATTGEPIEEARQRGRNNHQSNSMSWESQSLLACIFRVRTRSSRPQPSLMIGWDSRKAWEETPSKFIQSLLVSLFLLIITILSRGW